MYFYQSMPFRIFKAIIGLTILFCRKWSYFFGNKSKGLNDNIFLYGHKASTISNQAWNVGELTKKFKNKIQYFSCSLLAKLAEEEEVADDAKVDVEEAAFDSAWKLEKVCWWPSLETVMLLPFCCKKHIENQIRKLPTNNQKVSVLARKLLSFEYFYEFRHENFYFLIFY